MSRFADNENREKMGLVDPYFIQLLTGERVTSLNHIVGTTAYTACTLRSLTFLMLTVDGVRVLEKSSLNVLYRSSVDTRAQGEV